jgi:hypothetical protein
MLWNTKTPECGELRDLIERIPVIESHEHWAGICPANPELDILAWLTEASYYHSDLGSASYDFGDHETREEFSMCSLLEYVRDPAIAFDARYDAWRKYHDRTCHTAYTRSVLAGLKACWDLDGIEKSDLLAVQERMRAERGQAYADGMLAQHRVEGMVVNVVLGPYHELIEGKMPYRKDFARFVMGLPEYHALFTASDVRKPHLEETLGREIATLDDYLEAFEAYVQRSLDFGIVGFKDQSAYTREIAFGNPTRAEAEAVFNGIMARPDTICTPDEARPLDDFLFNHFMRVAARTKLPVQIHTGHMAGLRNDVRNGNPGHLTSLVDRHADVQFDLFHGGWPFMGEFLFLGKNYPNVNLDLCWVNQIDPLYSVELLQRGVMTVPHSKLMGFGGDTHLFETAIGSLILARDNIAIAFAGLVERGWFSLDDAGAVARAMLFDNPDRLFRGIEN